MTNTFYHLKGKDLKGNMLEAWGRSLKNARLELRSKGVWKVSYAVKVGFTLNLNTLQGVS